MADIFAGLICRPPRKEYVTEDLGPARYLLQEQMCVRNDLELVTRRKMKIKCSHYLPVDSESLQVEGQVPCVVYLHGNSGSRMDADDMVDTFLAEKISVFSIDFAGCGMSDGDFVTLGWREREDLEAVLNYLEGIAEISHVALYGRSMGAATAMLVASDERFYHRIVGMVLDSCYTSVRQVLLELAHKYVGKVPLVPFEAMIEPAVDLLRQAVLSRAGFDIDKIDVIEAARHCNAPVLFGHAADDQLVLASHTRNLYKEYGGPKQINVFEGDHNSIRPQDFRDQSLAHLRKCFAEAGEEQRPQGPGHAPSHQGAGEAANPSPQTGGGWSLFGLGVGSSNREKEDAFLWVAPPPDQQRASAGAAGQRPPSPSPPPQGAGVTVPGGGDGASEGSAGWKEHIDAADFASAPRKVAETPRLTPDKKTPLRSTPPPPPIPSPVKKATLLHSPPPPAPTAAASEVKAAATPPASLAGARDSEDENKNKAAAAAPPAQTPVGAAPGSASTRGAVASQDDDDDSFVTSPFKPLPRNPHPKPLPPPPSCRPKALASPSPTFFVPSTKPRNLHRKPLPSPTFPPPLFHQRSCTSILYATSSPSLTLSLNSLTFDVGGRQMERVIWHG
jgi:pimeloyl-ACP methyl ester carboxylesterase